MCKYVLLNGKILDKDNFFHAYESAIQHFADLGETVIAFSKMKFSDIKLKIKTDKLSLSPPNFYFDEQIFLGMMSFQDPPKKGVPQTIERIRVAGIKVVMITGDD